MEISKTSTNAPGAPITNMVSTDAAQATTTTQNESTATKDLGDLQQHSMSVGSVGIGALKVSKTLSGGAAKIIPPISSALAKTSVSAFDFVVNNGGGIVSLCEKVFNFVAENLTKVLAFAGIEGVKIPTLTFWL